MSARHRAVRLARWRERPLRASSGPARGALHARSQRAQSGRPTSTLRPGHALRAGADRASIRRPVVRGRPSPPRPAAAGSSTGPNPAGAARSHRWWLPVALVLAALPVLALLGREERRAAPSSTTAATAPAIAPTTSVAATPSMAVAPTTTPTTTPARAPSVIPVPIGTRTDDGLDVVLVLDDSSSTDSSDPKRNRVTAASRAVKFLRDEGRGQHDRVAVVHFAGRPGKLLGLTPVDTGIRQIEEALAPPLVPLISVGSGTRFAPALEAAGKALGPPRPGRRQVVVLFTDGVSDSGEDFGAVKAAVAKLPTSRVHLVALDADRGFDSVAPQWAELALSSTLRISKLSGGDEFQLALGRVFVEELGLTWGGR